LAARCARRASLELARFVPFRLNRLAAGVSEHLAAVYRGRFALEIPEWRVIATVGQRPDCTAQHVAASTRMHKTRVSRAIAQLLRRGLLSRAAAQRDRRKRRLRLSAAGRRLYAELVPLALERERALLHCLTAAERRGFLAGLAQLERVLRLSEPSAE
jgi:DNA-binding MarR family transcriptional regulator